MNIVERLINDEKRIRAEWDKFQREIVTLKNKFLNNIDMAFGDFDKTKLSPRVECDVFIAYNRTRKIYLDSGYPESVLPDTLEMKQVCSNMKKLNQRIREKVNSLLPIYAQQKAPKKAAP